MTKRTVFPASISLSRAGRSPLPTKQRIGLALLTGIVLLAGSGSVLGQQAFDWQQLGATTYDSNCSGCHQATGEGVPGGFPPLAGHLPAVVAAAGGRDYLIGVLLNGLEGEISVLGQSYSGMMPAWSFLSDEEIAAVLNHALTSWGNDAALPADFQPIQPAEVTAARATTRTPADMHTLRATVVVAEGTPATPAAAGAPVTFTAAQADRGKASYATNCLDCHGANLDDGEFGGPPLTGLSFEAKWLNQSPAAIYGFMSSAMPPDRPGALGAGNYAAILAYILQFNDYPAGDTELPSDPAALGAMTLAR